MDRHLYYELTGFYKNLFSDSVSTKAKEQLHSLFNLSVQELCPPFSAEVQSGELMEHTYPPRAPPLQPALRASRWPRLPRARRAAS